MRHWYLNKETLMKGIFLLAACASILAVALMLRFSLSMPQQAGMIEQAVYQTLETLRTQDISSPDKKTVSEETLFHAIFDALKVIMDRNNF